MYGMSSCLGICDPGSHVGASYPTQCTFMYQDSGDAGSVCPIMFSTWCGTPSGPTGSCARARVTAFGRGTAGTG